MSGGGFREAFRSLQNPQEISAPDCGYLFLSVAAPHEFCRDVGRIRFTIEAGDARAVIEIRADTDMLPANALGDVVDMIDVGRDIGTGHESASLVEESLLLLALERAITVVPSLEFSGQAARHANFRNLRASGGVRRREIGVERRYLHDSTVGLDCVELGIGEIARIVDERAGIGMRGSYGRACKLECLRERVRLELRHVDQCAEIIEPRNRLFAEPRQAAMF